MQIRVMNKVLKFPVIKTIRLARIVKNLMFLKAQTTARVRNKQTSVFQSKYDKYSLSGGTKKQVARATKTATQKTVFFFINLTIGISILLRVYQTPLKTLLEIIHLFGLFFKRKSKNKKGICTLKIQIPLCIFN